MTNGLIFFVTAIVSLFFILLMLRLGRRGLVGVLVTNVVLVSSFGALLVPLFGYTTNAGNVFYAAVFLVAQVMTEHFGKKTAYQSVWIGFGAAVLFALMAQYTIRMVPAPGVDPLADSMRHVFEVVPRITLASLMAYLVSQNLNVWLFSKLREQTGRGQLWLRSFCSFGAGQAVDSLLFFAIAFVGAIPGAQLAEIMIAGFAAKLAVGVLGIPMLYLSRIIVGRHGSGGRVRTEEN